MRKAVALDIICSALLLLFLYTALSKLAGYSSFAAVLRKSPLLEGAAPVIAWLLPIGEIGLSLLLFFPRTRLAGLYVSLVTLIVFTTYLSYMIAVATQLPCSCGGVLKNLTWRQHLVFNSACIGLSFLGILLHYSIRKEAIVRPGFPLRSTSRND